MQIKSNVGQKYCRMLQGEHSAILFTLIKLPFVIKIFVLSIFEWLFYTGFTVFGHVEHSSGAVRTACDIQIDGRQGAGRPRLTYKKLLEKDSHEWKEQERSTWRLGVRSAMCAANQLPEKWAH